MMPSTGPKYSVRWKSDPGATPSRTPGDQSRSVASSCRGLTSQLSPSASWVSPRASLPATGSTTGPTVTAGFCG